MSTESTHAQRCERCQRVTDTVRRTSWETFTIADESVAIIRQMCQRCRTEVRDAIASPRW